MAKRNIQTVVKQRFGYDVSDLEDYVDAQSPEIMTDLVYSAGLTSRISVQENNKGAELIKILTSTPVLQAASTCGWTPSGGIVLTDVTLTTVRVKIQEEYCNEDLNGTWGQLMNAAGANVQDTVAPEFGDIMIAYYQSKARKMNQDLMINGDTTSLDSDLVFYDGFKKLWDNDPLVNVYYSGQTAITSSNAFSIAIGMANETPSVLFENSVRRELMVGRETYQKIIQNIYNDNNFHWTLTDQDGAEPSFVLPTTTLTVRAYDQLNGTDDMYLVPLDYMFFGTDLEGDIEGFEFKYNEHDEKLRFGVKWRSGVQYIFPQYFTRLRLTPTS